MRETAARLHQRASTDPGDNKLAPLAYARCMREPGLPDFRGPKFTRNGRPAIVYYLPDSFSPQSPAVLKAPEGLPPTSLTGPMNGTLTRASSMPTPPEQTFTTQTSIRRSTTCTTPAAMSH